VFGVAFSSDGRTLVSCGADTTVLVWGVTGGPAARGKAAPTPAELEKLWEALAAPDAGWAYDAICRLAASPGQAVPLLRDRLPGEEAASIRVSRALEVLEQIGTPQARAVLKQMRR
jgi:hypothetical protein